MASGFLQNLDQRFSIVGPDGKPTDYFMRLLRDRKVASKDIQTIVDEIVARQVIAGSGLDGGGALGGPGDITLTADTQEILDAITTTQGSILYRGASSWSVLSPGTSGQFLKTNGPGADPSWASGGGGGGSTLFYDTLQVMGQAASGTAFATKGNYFKPLANTTLDSLVAYMTLVSGATYRARCYEVSGKSTTATITAIVDNGVDFVASAAVTLDTVRLRFSSTVNLVAGTTYLLAVSRTDGANNYILPVGANTGGAGQGFAFPCTVGGGRGQIALASPVVGSVTGGYAAGGFFSIGVIGDPGTLT